MATCMEESKPTGEPSGEQEVKTQSIEDPNTHIRRGHMRTPLSEWYGWEVDARRDVQVIDDRVSMNWN